MIKIKINYLRIFIICFSLMFGGCGASRFSSEVTMVQSDPLLKYAWHLENTGQYVFATQPGLLGFDLNLSKTWTQKIDGSGVRIQVSDDGIEDTQEDLQQNFSYLNVSKNYSLSSPYTSTVASPIASDDNHGTSVAGLIAAVGANGLGSRGVAPKAQLSAANILSSAVTASDPIKLDQASGSFDISNMSWGMSQDSLTQENALYAAQLKSMVTTGRNGKGVLFVKASGNDFAVYCHGSASTYCIGNSNLDSDNASPYIISVGALNAIGESASYSSTGANLWISSFGGEFGSDTPAMITTDRMGCAKGFSVSSSSFAFDAGTNSENSNCNYTATFNGTSSAAPVLSGVIALILNANPQLTWRQVKYILAKTAVPVKFETGSITHPLSSVLPSGYEWDQKWITNAAQFKFHNWYGFGKVDVDEAVNLAVSSNVLDLGTYTETQWDAAHTNTSLSLAVPDNSISGVTNTISVATNMKIEAVQIRVQITHPDISELALELTSPSGTKSVIINARNSLTGIANYTGETFLTNAFYQENSAGNWTLKVVDGKAGNTGTLNSFSINFFGGVH